MIAYAPPVEQCRVADTRLAEASGLVASDLEDGVVFTHNDSGDKARFFALGPDCRTRAVYDLKGATARDWEDIARGPDHVLWLGDIGDNGRTRSSIAVYRVVEPRSDERGSVPWTRYRFTYPDGPHDAETLLADPVDGRLYVLTKSLTGDVGLYAAPLPVRDGVLAQVASVPLSFATGGDISPDGTRLVVRNYASAFETVIPKGRSPRLAGVFERGPGTAVALGSEQQGEAVAYSRDGRSLLTLSEGVGAALQVLGPGTTTPAPSASAAAPAPVAEERRRWPWLVGAALLLVLLAAATRATARRP